jgi:hypothetical protein
MLIAVTFLDRGIFAVRIRGVADRNGLETHLRTEPKEDALGDLIVSSSLGGFVARSGRLPRMIR